LHHAAFGQGFVLTINGPGRSCVAAEEAEPFLLRETGDLLVRE
jgi:hypothetical protein